MDMMFVVMDPGYYGILTRYHQALKSRNALLKRGAPAAQRKPFEDQLIQEGWRLSQTREELLEVFRPHFETAYSGISGVEESPVLEYEPSIGESDEAAYARAFEASWNRDRDTGTTNRGPHRDDLGLRLQGHAAREFASEGQQRGLVLALRMGLVAWYRKAGGTPPVILADDIVGELDADRKRGFWRMLGEESQLIATGTVFPREDDFHQWTNWNMSEGDLQPDEMGCPE